MKCLHYTEVIQLISISTYSKTKLLRKKLVQDFRLDGLADKQSTVSQHSRKLKALILLSEKHSVDSFFVDPSTHFCIKGTSCFNLSGCLTTQPFNGLFSKTTWVSRYQKGKTNLDFTGARDSEWQWHQLSHMQVCTSLQTDNHASTPPLCFLQARCPSCHPTNSVKALKAV